MQHSMVAAWPVTRLGERARAAAVSSDPLVLAIAVLTLLGLGLRLFYLLHNGFLLAVAEYDDGPYFGSAVRLTQGVLPYRDFVLVQPPGITLLMVPCALLAKACGTAAALVTGRIATALAGAASIPLAGLLVRHRGMLATVAACGLMAVYPDAVAAAHTVLVEPWLVLFTLLGAVLLFDGDQPTARRNRLVLAGVALGFASAVELWAIVPAAILLVTLLMTAAPGAARRRLNRAAAFAIGAAAGFAVPVAPFVAASPSGFYRSLVVAQIGHRPGAIRVGMLERLYDLAGLSDFNSTLIGSSVQVRFWFIHLTWPQATFMWIVAAMLYLAVAGGPMLLAVTRNQAPGPLDWLALSGTSLVIAMFLWPSQFHYHFAAFLAPFLALAVALPLARIIPAGAARSGPAVVAAALLITILAVIQARSESGRQPGVPASAIAAAERRIPPGSCVVSDSVTMLLLANRFNSSVPGCTLIDDGLGTDLALSGGLTPATGAGAVPAVARLWFRSIRHAQFLWLSSHYALRIPLTEAEHAYIRQHFRLIYADSYGDTLSRADRPGAPGQGRPGDP